MKKQQKEIYISMDIEADGKFPGLNSLYSLGGAAFTEDKKLHGVFGINLETLPEATEDPETMDFWKRNPVAYKAARLNPVAPNIAIQSFIQWMNDISTIVDENGNVVRTKKVFAGYPAPYDFKWIDYYTLLFNNYHNPFGHSRCVDMKSIAWTDSIHKDFCSTAKRNFKKSWFDKLPHTHIAEDDAIEQGCMFINMLRDFRGQSKVEKLILADNLICGGHVKRENVERYCR